MEFLKDALGEKYTEFEGLITAYNEQNPDKPLKVINLEDGRFIEKEKYSALEEKFKKETESLKSKAGKDKLYYEVELKLLSEKPKNTKALKALLDFDKITYSDGVLVGLDEQIEALKVSDGYLFDSGDVPQFSRPVGGADEELTREEFKKLSYMDKLKLKNEAPKIFSKLKHIR